MDFILIIGFLIILILFIYYINRFDVALRSIKNMQTADVGVANQHELTSYELERLNREEKFDERINRLKEELAFQQNIIRQGIPADELHPLVKNLPHDIIRKYIEADIEEIAD